MAAGPAPVEGAFTLLGLLALSFAIGVVATLGGVGGGVLFTPIMMGFTNLHPDLVRAAGLAVACYSSIMAGITFFRQRIAPFKFVILASVILLPAAIIGSMFGIYVAALGKWGMGLIRALLGIMMFIVVALMTVKRIDWPEARPPGRLARAFGLEYTYFEKTLNREVTYCPVRLHIVLALLFLLGFCSGFFGLGAAWAMIPVYNLVALLPLKVTAATAKSSLAFADAGALWVYIHSGKACPEIFATCSLAVIVGAWLGARLLLIAKAAFIRWLIIAIMIFNGIQLVTRGTYEMGMLPFRLF